MLKIKIFQTFFKSIRNKFCVKLQQDYGLFIYFIYQI